VLEASVRRIEDLGDDNLVLDVGGWARPLARADWVMDLMPYETRGRYGSDGQGPERFRQETWIERDLCDREPFPFSDGQFDFVVCSHTLEDLRDPVWVCAEMNRVGRAGYVEVPSRLEEQRLGVHGPWAGWSHHRWLCDVSGSGIEFVFKPAMVHARSSDNFPADFGRELTAEQRVQTLWWEGGFEYGERIFMEPAELDDYLAGYVGEHLGPRRAPGGLRRLLGR
jgi:methyltransferase family protein